MNREKEVFMKDSVNIKNIRLRIRVLPFFALLEREIRRFVRVLIQAVLIPVMNSSMYLIIFGVSLGASLNMDLGVPYLQFIIPGLVMMACLSNAFQNGSSSILTLKFGGDIIDIRMSPLTLQQTLWALAFGGVCRGLLVGFTVLAVGEVFHYIYLGEWLIPYSTPYLLFFLIIAGLVFSKIGVVIALWAQTFEHIGAVGGFIILPLTYLGGVFFSLKMLTPFWQTVSLFNPMFYFINGVRHSLIGISDVPIESAVLISSISLVICHILCIFSMKYGRYRRW